MMKPHEELEALSPYLDGELDSVGRAAVEAHLPTCAECRHTLSALRAAAADLALLPEPRPSERDSWALRAAIARARAPRGRLLQAAAAVGSVAAVLVGFIAFGGSRLEPDQVVAGALGSASQLVVEVSDAAFDADSARELMLTVSTSSLTGAPAEDTAGGQSEAFAEMAPRSARSAADDEDFAGAVAVCEQQEVLEGAPEPYAAERYLIATFGGERAMFLIYAVGDPPTRRELWVMSLGECSVLHWEQGDS
jgi:hypothetical protein